MATVFLLSAEAAFTVASDPALPPADALVVFDEGRSTFAHLGEGGDLLYLGSQFASKGSRLLIDSLPPVIHLSAGETGTGRLQWLIEELVRETTSTVPGTVAARSGLANLMFLQLLRGYLSQERGVNVGWLRAACDPKLAPALSLMHRDPARNWHLPELAKAAAMSRTSFATYFKAIAGVGPLSYLTEWRMWLAERKLREGGQSVSMIAHSVGYASEAAFSTAYKRVMGRSPRRQVHQVTAS